MYVGSFGKMHILYICILCMVIDLCIIVYDFCKRQEFTADNDYANHLVDFPSYYASCFLPSAGILRKISISYILCIITELCIFAYGFCKRQELTADKDHVNHRRRLA